jgi:hypothetical protein
MSTLLIVLCHEIKTCTSVHLLSLGQEKRKVPES